VKLARKSPQDRNGLADTCSGRELGAGAEMSARISGKGTTRSSVCANQDPFHLKAPRVHSGLSAVVATSALRARVTVTTTTSVQETWFAAAAIATTNTTEQMTVAKSAKAEDLRKKQMDCCSL